MGKRPTSTHGPSATVIPATFFPMFPSVQLLSQIARPAVQASGSVGVTVAPRGLVVLRGKRQGLRRRAGDGVIFDIAVKQTSASLSI